MLNIYKLFDDSLKLSFLAIFLFLPVLICIFEKLEGSKKNAIQSMNDNYFMFFSIMNFVSVKLPRFWSSRLVTGSVILVWLVIGNTYVGKMIEFLNTNYGLK